MQLTTCTPDSEIQLVRPSTRNTPTCLGTHQSLHWFKDAVTGPGSLTSYAYANDDGAGRDARMCIWYNTGNDTTGALSRSKKIANTASKLLGTDLYHYHSKIMMKDARDGGRFVWHQDYGYWYSFGYLFPDMLTVFMALDPCGRENGCLQVIRGSHRCGRIDHSVVGDQKVADLERVAQLEKRLETLHVELKAGDAIFFHSNLLHSSSSNTSEQRRWAIASAYNSVHNVPDKDEMVGKQCRGPIQQLDNEAVVKTGVNRDLSGKEVKVKRGAMFEFETFFPA
ncbi:L-proline trans-4-hydroxylase-like [Physella acuta]|uniref:L-proline trans-4-hydroxylase-like n=1 Tax=Physella acuta TaxID=109671 RepID=UPI0027DE85CF|nr:L-proline trans-4-hydroxylase-like [Physella acuta]